MSRTGIAVACALMGIAAFARADEAAVSAVSTSVFASSDSEGFETRRFGAEYRFGKTGGLVPGIAVRHHMFTQEGWNRSAEQVLLTAKGNAGKSGLELQGDVGLLSQHGRQLLTMDATLHAQLAAATSMEAFINRDYVETAAALDLGIHANFIGASIEQGLGPHWTAVVLFGQQDFSDGNLRTQGRVRLIYQPSLDLGLTLQLRYRGYDSNADGARRAYFNPERYREGMALVGWRKHTKDWQASALAGLGRQHVNDDAGMPARLFEASLDKTLPKQQTLSLKAAYNQSASFGGPDYRYRQLQLTWGVRF